MSDARAPLAIVTCGPGYEPIDAVRRMTNHSTGELGAVLCKTLAAAGFRVLCLRGEIATHPAPSEVRVIPFSTNASLEEALEQIPETPNVIFHAAALCDFALADASGFAGAKKIPSRTPELVLTLRPAKKILPLLRPLFPEALIVGWKYEMEGRREDAISRALAQTARAGTDACVANGAAYGPGFGFVEAGAELPAVPHFPGKPALCRHLAEWTLERV